MTGTEGEPWRDPPPPGPSRFTMPDPAVVAPGAELVAVGADLSPGTLLDAYRAGLFPMPVDPDRRRRGIAWYSPDPRGVLPLGGLHVSRSLRRSLRRYRVTRDESFERVVRACADPSRPGRWITPDFVDAYTTMFELGWGHSVETWHGDDLVGGLYGLRIGRFFAGEAMFSTASDASKVALVSLVEWLRGTGATLLDVQWRTDHLATLGVVEVDRTEYLRSLAEAVGT
ncbi:leucyl/phenylalanyl-tRNA--protein transferase [Ilumatobacter sp.]|uniref:leucyl/phenylalanyl-tRNA--protein transferase n=1 Tax=Ilumatobacter sp. TaxID=1967498 RepID=UPI003B51D2EB